LRLCEIVQDNAEPLVAPLLGYPGARLTGTTLRQNLSDAAVHVTQFAASGRTTGTTSYSR